MPAGAVIVQEDDVKLTSSGYDFGGETWVAGAPTGKGELHWHHENGTIRPHLVGHLHLDEADGSCGRMRIEYFDAWESLLATRYGGEVCADDDHHHEWDVDLDPFTADEIVAVDVAVQAESSSGWSTMEEEKYWIGTMTDELKITESKVDFGSEDFAAGAPMRTGYVDWEIDDAVVTPNIWGYLHLNNSDDVCARLNVRYRTEAGAHLFTEPGDEHCAPNGGHHSWYVFMDDEGSDKVGEINVQLQTRAPGGSWTVEGNEIVALAP